MLPSDEFRALVEAERGTAPLSFSSSSSPTPSGSGSTAPGCRPAPTSSRPGLTFDGLRPGPKPLRPFINGLQEGKDWREGGGDADPEVHRRPGSYEGLFELLARFYRGSNRHGAPVTHARCSR